MAGTSVLHRGELVVTSRWVCPPGSPQWRQRVRTGDDGFLVAVPRLPVGIRHEGRHGIWADHGSAVLYDPGQAYERKLLHPDGDRADVLGFAPAVVHEAVGGSFGVSAVPLSDAVFLQQRVAFRSGEPLLLEETALAVLAAVAGHLTTRAVRGDARLVARTRHVLSQDLGARVTMTDVAREVSVSPYHLARVFKAETGSTLHGYREGLRLRVAADRAMAGDRLTDVAADLGFASHSHLTSRFRRRFGTTPSALARA